MGFRDLRQFNIALLGKHGWRFMTKPDSLCTRVMKGRYFPDCDFMQATIPKSASATWRAIIAGRQALDVGLVKRIGDGTTTSVWEDRWLPSTVSMRPLLRPPDTTINMVSDLIDYDNWSWKRDLIRATFITPDAEAILNIPLRRGGGEDFYAWAHERSGIYSVKIAYRALVNQNKRLALEEGQIAGPSKNEQQMWSAIWKLKVVPKVRVFWWRVLTGFLPSYGELHRRHISDHSICPMCIHEDESHTDMWNPYL